MILWFLGFTLKAYKAMPCQNTPLMPETKDSALNCIGLFPRG